MPARRRLLDRILAGLVQHLQHVSFELGQLVQEEHAVVGERDLAGPGDRAAAGEPRVGDGVVRNPKWALRDQRVPGRKQSGDTVQFSDLRRDP